MNRNDSTEQDQGLDEALAGAARNLADNQLGADLESFRGLVSKIVREEADHLDADGYEEMVDEAIVAVFEYLHGGGDAIAGKISAVVRGRVRAHRPRVVRLTQGEERVLRLAAGVRSELETQGRSVGTDALLRAVTERCWEWARERSEDDEQARRKLTQRGILRLLESRELFGDLMSVANTFSFDQPLGEDGASAGELHGTTDEPFSPEDRGELLGPLTELLGSLDDSARTAVLWASGIEGDAGASRAQIAAACNMTTRELNQAMDRLGWYARCPHTSWALFEPGIESRFDVVNVPVEKAADHDEVDAAVRGEALELDSFLSLIPLRG